jgi:hypothetical protein
MTLRENYRQRVSMKRVMKIICKLKREKYEKFGENSILRNFITSIFLEVQ